MASSGIWVEGADRVFMNMNRVVDSVAKESMKGIKKAGMEIIAQAQRNMRTAGHNGATLNNTGRLSQSGRVQDVQNDPNAVDVGFFSDEGGRGYAAFVEYGTKAHSAPLEPIRQWVKKKMRVAANSVNTVAFFIHRRIRRRGTNAHAFFAPAVQKNKEAVSKAISEAVQSVINKNL